MSAVHVRPQAALGEQQPTAGSAESGRVPPEFAAWLVDLDGTLYRQPFVRAMMAAELLLGGRSALRILRTFRHQQEHLRASPLPARSDPFALQIERTAQRLGVPRSDVAAVVDHWMVERPARWLRLFRRRQFLRAIVEFRAHGGRTALVSDYPARVKLAALGAAELFDVVIACGEPDGPCSLKPDPAGLLLASQRLAVPAEACLVIGDRPEVDGEAARRAGMVFRHIGTSWFT